MQSLKIPLTPHKLLTLNAYSFTSPQVATNLWMKKRQGNVCIRRMAGTGAFGRKCARGSNAPSSPPWMQQPPGLYCMGGYGGDASGWQGWNPTPGVRQISSLGKRFTATSTSNRFEDLTPKPWDTSVAQTQPTTHQSDNLQQDCLEGPG